MTIKPTETAPDSWEAPTWLAPDARDEWARLVAELRDRQGLDDTLSLEAMLRYCVAFDAFLKLSAELSQASAAEVSSLMSAVATASRLLRTAAKDLGVQAPALTPASSRGVERREPKDWLVIAPPAPRKRTAKTAKTTAKTH